MAQQKLPKKPCGARGKKKKETKFRVTLLGQVARANCEDGDVCVFVSATYGTSSTAHPVVTNLVPRREQVNFAEDGL